MAASLIPRNVERSNVYSVAVVVLLFTATKEGCVACHQAHYAAGMLVKADETDDTDFAVLPRHCSAENQFAANLLPESGGMILGRANLKMILQCCLSLSKPLDFPCYGRFDFTWFRSRHLFLNGLELY